MPIVLLIENNLYEMDKVDGYSQLPFVLCSRNALEMSPMNKYDAYYLYLARMSLEPVA